ncbi:MAG: hypothetical protein IPG74_12675 [Flavobacteriales bacterium]|nr:hypothetical protein [Flavobacteriales bacterium]
MAVKRYDECIKLGYPKEDVYRYKNTVQGKLGDLDGATARPPKPAWPNS